jgi:hypothetical protein
MKKTRIQKKLMLSKETLRNLSERDMQEVAGANYTLECETEPCGPTKFTLCTPSRCNSC